MCPQAPHAVHAVRLGPEVVKKELSAPAIFADGVPWDCLSGGPARASLGCVQLDLPELLLVSVHNLAQDHR
jgi:hypothetical protein